MEAPRWLRLLLLTLPTGFRREFADDIHLHVEWMRRRRPGGGVVIFVAVVVDVLRVAMTERFGLRGTMWSDQGIRRAGVVALVGGVLALAVTPLMVVVKYATGWSIIPPPAWEGVARSALQPFVSFATPVQLWMLYGAAYSVALILMTAGVLAVRARTKDAGTLLWRSALWVLLVGLSLVLVGDALHTATWHLGGETVPRPGLNAVAGFGMSLSYLGMPIIFIASFALGLSACRHRIVPRLVAVLLLVVGPGGAVLTATQIPTMPSGSLSVFSVTMILLGHALAKDRLQHVRVA